MPDLAVECKTGCLHHQQFVPKYPGSSDPQIPACLASGCSQLQFCKFEAVVVAVFIFAVGQENAWEIVSFLAFASSSIPNRSPSSIEVPPSAASRLLFNPVWVVDNLVGD